METSGDEEGGKVVPKTVIIKQTPGSSLGRGKP